MRFRLFYVQLLVVCSIGSGYVYVVVCSVLVREREENVKLTHKKVEVSTMMMQ